MEEDMKECRNKKCPRKDVLLLAPGRRYCSSCGAKLKNVWTDNPRINDNTPPMLDPGPDSPPRGNGRTTVAIMRRGNVTTFKPVAPTAIVASGGGPLEIVPFQKFRGNWSEYKVYEEEFKSGKFEKFNVDGTERDTSDTFECTDPDIEGCPLVPAKQTLVHLPYDMHQKWIWLCKAFNTEWIAYLKGDKDAVTGVWTITEMYFPKQRANGTHVDAEDGEIQEGTIGSVHSHVGMNAFFSAEDKKHFNHIVEMVVNRDGNLAIAVRVPLACGKFTRANSNALLINMTTFEEAKDDLASKLTDQSSKYHSNPGYQYGTGGRSN